MIDSCLHLKKNSFAHIKYISNKIKLLKIRKAFCYYDLEKTNSDRKIFTIIAQNLKILFQLLTLKILKI